MKKVLFLSMAMILSASTAFATDFVYTGTGWSMFSSTGGAFNSNTGKLWFHEHSQGVMHEYNVDGTPTGTVVGTPGDPDMHGLAYNPNTNHYWASETGSLVWEFLPDGTPVQSWAPAGGDQCGLAVDYSTNNLYWTTYSYGAIIEYAPDGTPLNQFGVTTNPLSLEFICGTGTILVSDQGGTILVEMNTAGGVINSWNMGSLIGTTVRIRAMAYDDQTGHLYIANENDNRVYKLQDVEWMGPSATENVTWSSMKKLYK